MLVGDPTRLRQVMTNLIGNALKFTDSGGLIQVEIEQLNENDKKATVRFSVKDSGIGISPEQKTKIFDAFSQADISTTRQFGGTGLGLAITSDLVRHMGGHLDVASELGKGSEFFFTLELEKAGEEKKKNETYAKQRVAYYRPETAQIARTCDDWPVRYLREITPYAERITSLPDDIEKHYDILMLDYSVAEIRENIAAILALDIKIVLVGYISYKEEIDALGDDHVAIIYRPLTFTKIMRAFARLSRTEADATVEAKAIEAKQEDKESSFSGLKVLVAEDNDVNQKLIQAVLDGLDLDVTLAENGKIAVEYRQNNDYDLILMDIQMPVMGGIDATQEILTYEQENHLPHIPIIALTANALQGDREKYLRAGMDDYISKPIQIDQIRHVIAEHCQEQLAEKERETPTASEAASPEPVSLVEQTESSAEEHRRAAVLSDETPSVEKSAEPERKQETAALSKDERDVLLYCRPGLTQRLHRHILEQEGLQVDLAEDETEFFARFDAADHRFVLIEAKLIPDDNCVLLDVIRESGSRPLVYGMDHPSECVHSEERYTAIEELRRKLSA